MYRAMLLVLFLLTISACNPQNDGAEKQNLVNVKNTAIEEVNRKTGQEISRRLVKLATSIPDVNGATAVVFGKYAIVGIDVDSNIERSEVGTIKYSVAESLKHDPFGARAVVVADPDMNARLKEISQDIQNGEPIQGIMNELSDITGRLMPEVPSDMIEPKPKNATEKPKDKLKKSQKKELDKEQQKQSNYQK
ncbi:YhcN/YlaJ family sporulation lipoprotein [Bacillus methanolicus]|uniref:Sporulation lipoprotein, YhcN/YlaJ family n=1 Tax=Bacillus methanolicus (strain MGA3 / ATCC 53907) TaxID=796606 RepID=I3DYW3_BACMM|nr:YhcN/YlaJ family sporulation lipoprotein [Bacillus methanolicus]AIE59509.1 sporulation lipoprotein, YhcN/YlaJ family [Bacillus methanolicus MGA3]EIJ79434.1 putative lipoprotein [Bacillus methanolicus MGA3]